MKLGTGVDGLLCGLIVGLKLDIVVAWFDSCCIYLGIRGLGKHRLEVKLGFGVRFCQVFLSKIDINRVGISLG